MVAARSRRARYALEQNTELWDLMTRAAAGTAVTGASYSDYLTLYEQVKSFKPREVVEFGTGITSVVLAQALDRECPGGWKPCRTGHIDGG